MIFFAIIGVFWLKLNYVIGSSQQRSQQVLPAHLFNSQQIPVQYGAYLQQLETAGAQVLPVQHSVTVNHSPYTFYPKPQVFYPPPLPALNQYTAPPQPKLAPEKAERPLNIQQLNNQKPIQFLSTTPQYIPQQIQFQQIQPLKSNQEGIQIVNPPNLGHVQYNNIPAHAKIPQGHPPVQPYVSQGDKFRQQTSGKFSPNKPNEEKHFQHYQDQKRPVQTLPPQPIRNQPQGQERRRKGDEEDEKERDEEPQEDSEEESEEEDESGEEYESEDEEEDPQDEKVAASDLPPERNRSKYDFDNRNYGPTFEAAKHIFNDREQKNARVKSFEEEVPRYHKEKEFKYAYHKNTKSRPKQGQLKEPNRERSKFVFYDSEPKFNHYEPTYEPNEPIFEPRHTPRRINAKRVEITNGKPKYYYYSSTDPKLNNNNRTASNKDANPQATRKKTLREKWFVLTKET